ncbi:MAG: AAA family ATPase [Thermodesulfovibrionales bacterium]
MDKKIVILEGGPGVGKTTALKDRQQELTDQGITVYYINATEPITAWFKDYVPLPFKRAEALVSYFLNTLPNEFYLLIDNADSVTNTSDNRKTKILEQLLLKAKGATISCQHWGNLAPSLKARLKDAERKFIGSGNLGFDITYILLALIIIAVALMGQHNLIFIAAAMRYMFQGLRIGGRQ